jgi:WD40 repeat protein
VWDVSTGKELGQFRGDDGTVIGLAFSPDGKFLASTSIGMTGLVWDFDKFRR